MVRMTQVIEERNQGEDRRAHGQFGRPLTLMTKFPKTCGPEFSLGEAARLMLEDDCGRLPVVAEGGCGGWKGGPRQN